MDTPGNLVDSPTHRYGESIFEYEYLRCAADFSLLNLPKGKSLGRSKPATNS